MSYLPTQYNEFLGILTPEPTAGASSIVQSNSKTLANKLCALPFSFSTKTTTTAISNVLFTFDQTLGPAQDSVDNGLDQDGIFSVCMEVNAVAQLDTTKSSGAVLFRCYQFVTYYDGSWFNIINTFGEDLYYSGTDQSYDGTGKSLGITLTDTEGSGPLLIKSSQSDTTAINWSLLVNLYGNVFRPDIYD